MHNVKKLPYIQPAKVMVSAFQTDDSNFFFIEVELLLTISMKLMIRI